MFPITYRHQFNYTVQGDERWIAGMLRTRIVAAVTKKGAQIVAVVDHCISFEGRYFLLTWSWWNLFRYVSKGHVIIVCHDGKLSVTTEISFIGLALFTLCASVFSVVGVIVLVYFGIATSSILEVLGIWLCAIWLWVFGGTVLFTSYLFRGLMRDQLKHFFDSAASTGIQSQRIASR